ncbi:hypothetical protein SAMN05421504_11423 [Amycolatopsis xylanica]|uniref:Uncharacterized protein n=1 Tax=Amycolatopsis xylanica TaxID=589385 RepID=A0A1H3SJF4_9PSEU|nr:hypothetical protein SAMN05421504_11423 [Amycolatopsis xylanica]
MRTARERQMVLSRTRDVEPVRILEDQRVAVGRRAHDDDLTVLFDQLPADFDVLVGHPQRKMGRRLEAKYLVDHVRHQVPVGQQHFPLVAIVQQGDDRVADQVRGRLEPGEEQRLTVDDRFLRRDLTGIFRADQRGHDVVARVFAAAVEQFAEQGVQLDAGGFVLAQLGDRADSVARQRDDIAVLLETRQFVMRVVVDAEQVGDHPQRQRLREVGQQIEVVARFVEQSVRDPLDALGVGLHQFRAEIRRDQPPQPVVVRRVLEQQRVPEVLQREPAHVALAGQLTVGLADAEPRILQQLGAQLMRKDRVDTGRAAVDRTFRAHALIGRVRVFGALPQQNLQEWVTGACQGPRRGLLDVEADFADQVAVHAVHTGLSRGRFKRVPQVTRRSAKAPRALRRARVRTRSDTGRTPVRTAVRGTPQDHPCE